MADLIGDAFQLAVMWMVMYGLLAFGWVHLRRVYKVEGGLVFGAMFYIYTVAGALGLAYTFALLGLRAMGSDVGFLKPVEDVVWNLSSLIQLIGVFAVVTGIVLFIARFVQNRRHRDDVPPPVYHPPQPTAIARRRPPKRKAGRT